MAFCKQAFSILLLTVLLFSCAPKEDAKQIVQDAIAAHGGNNYEKLQVSFDFRGKLITINQQKDSYDYSRTFTDSNANKIVDAVSNQGFQRKINDQVVTLSDSLSMVYKEATNSIAYFILLPYKLSEPAVQLEYLGQITIDQQLYNKVKVSFKQEGGGKDHGDVFCYWFNAKTKMLDYLAYSNGGPRFRKATQRTTIKSVVFQNYDNYVLEDTLLATSDYDSAFIKGKIKLLSKIEQTDYK